MSQERNLEKKCYCYYYYDHECKGRQSCPQSCVHKLRSAWCWLIVSSLHVLFFVCLTVCTLAESLPFFFFSLPLSLCTLTVFHLWIRLDQNVVLIAFVDFSFISCLSILLKSFFAILQTSEIWDHFFSIQVIGRIRKKTVSASSAFANSLVTICLPTPFLDQSLWKQDSYV